jgi:hypothetical protein
MRLMVDPDAGITADLAPRRSVLPAFEAVCARFGQSVRAPLHLPGVLGQSHGGRRRFMEPPAAAKQILGAEYRHRVCAAADDRPWWSGGVDADRPTHPTQCRGHQRGDAGSAMISGLRCRLRSDASHQ